MTPDSHPDSPASGPAAPGAAVPSDRAAAFVGAGILLSRVSGLIREMVLSAWLGATTLAAEAFAFALGVPKLIQNLLGEGALSASFIPVYSQVVDADPRGAKRLAGAVFGLLATLVGALVLLLMVAARPIVSLIARGADAERLDLVAELVRVMAPGIGFIVFAAWCLGILNAHRLFFLSYVAPVLWNAAIVAAVVLWSTRTDDLTSIAQAAAWGVFIGGVAQFAVQMPKVLAVAGPITPSLDRSMATTRQVMRRFVPGVAGRGVQTLSTFTDLALSSYLAVGAFAVITKAQTLYLMPISVFAVSIAAADLPELSRGVGGDIESQRRVARSVDRVVFFMVFTALAFILGGRSIVGALFERREFSSDDTVAVWLTLAVLSFGLVGTGLSRLLQNAAFAGGDVAGPARIALLRLIVAAAIGVALMWPADRFGVVDGVVRRLDPAGFSPLDGPLRTEENSHRLGAVGLAAGGAVAAWLEFALLRRRVGAVASQLGMVRALGHLLPAAIVGGAALLGLAALTESVPPLVAAPIVVGASGVTYLALAAWRGNSTARQLIDFASAASARGGTRRSRR